MYVPKLLINLDIHADIDDICDGNDICFILFYLYMILEMI